MGLKLFGSSGSPSLNSGVMMVEFNCSGITLLFHIVLTSAWVQERKTLSSSTCARKQRKVRFFPFFSWILLFLSLKTFFLCCNATFWKVLVAGLLLLLSFLQEVFFFVLIQMSRGVVVPMSRQQNFKMRASILSLPQAALGFMLIRASTMFCLVYSELKIFAVDGGALDGMKWWKTALFDRKACWCFVDVSWRGLWYLVSASSVD